MTIAIIVVVVLLVAVVGWAVVTYNGLVRLRNLVQEAWRQIDVELTRRHDLIGNLVETVKGYAAHERGTLEDVVAARAAAMAPGQSPAPAGREREHAQPGARPAARHRRGLPRPQGQRELHGPPGRADLHRGPHRLGPPLLQRHGPRPQHQGRDRAEQHRRRAVQRRAGGVLRGRRRAARGAAGRLRPARRRHPAPERVCRRLRVRPGHAVRHRPPPRRHRPGADHPAP